MDPKVTLEIGKLLGASSTGAKMRGGPKPNDKIVLDCTRMLGNNSAGATMNSPKPASIKPGKK